MDLTIPSDLSEIKLNQAQRFWIINQNEKISDQMKWIHGVATFSDKPIERIMKLKIKDVQKVYLEIADLILPDSKPGEDKLIRFFEYGGTKYGFEPDLREMETGAFMDLDEYVKDVNKNLHKVMAILYRPVVLQNKELYLTASYVSEPSWKRDHRQKILLREMTYDYVRGAVNFFLKAATRHSNTSGNAADSAENQTTTLNHGDGSISSTDSQKETSQKAKKSQKNPSTKH
jgi:hypothetical protein